jgi:alpha/beta superfamily hydrolase
MPRPSERAVRIPLLGTDVTLEGVLHSPARSVPGLSDPGAPGPVVLCHPHPAFGGHMDTPLMLALASDLAASSHPTLRFNFRGVGGSSGTPTGGVSEHEDVELCAQWMSGDSERPPHLVGYSFGAGMALQAVLRGTEAASVCCIALPTEVAASFPGFLDRYRDRARNLPPMLFLAGDQDQFCDPGWITAVLDAPRMRLEVLRGEDHFFDGPGQQRVVDRVVEYLAQVGPYPLPLEF